MMRDEEIDLGRLESLHYAAAISVVVVISGVSGAVARVIATGQNMAADTALALGASYARGRRLAMERIGRLEQFIGSITGGGDPC